MANGFAGAPLGFQELPARAHLAGGGSLVARFALGRAGRGRIRVDMEDIRVDRRCMNE